MGVGTKDTLATEVRNMQREEALQVLGLTRDPTRSQLKARYRELMRRFHSDVGGCDFRAKRINAARDALAGSSNRPDVAKDDPVQSSDTTRAFTNEEIVKYLVEEFKRTENIDLRDDRLALVRVTTAANQARKTLSFANAVQCMLPYMHYGTHLNVMVSPHALLSRRK